MEMLLEFHQPAELYSLEMHKPLIEVQAHTHGSGGHMSVSVTTTGWIYGNRCLADNKFV